MPGMREEKLAAGVPYVIRQTQMKQVIFDIRKEENPCALCAKMRRGALHEAAKAAGIPPENLVATVREYNEAVKKGAAAKLNPPYLVASPKPLETAPYYLIPVAGGICSTMGGIAINTKTEVLNNENKVIPGLYAAGASTGGIWYDDDLGGNQLGGCMVFGRIAGRSAAERAQKRV